MISMPLVGADSCRLHEPGGEIFVGVRMPATEVPARLDRIRDALSGATLVDAVAHDDGFLLEVHDAKLVEYLSGAWEDWSTSGLTRDPRQDRVVPYVFPHGALAGAVTPAATWARPGRFCYDTMTLIGPGTWEAARAAVDAALTAADLVSDGAAAAYACVRPPGHHAGICSYGGSCYLNNSAVAGAALAKPFGDVAVLDVDAHHGNGTQEIFRGRDDVVTGSVHVDPGAGWFPHFVGFAAENDAGNRNVPLAPGTGDDHWLEAVRALVEWARGARALVVPLGVDAAASDPESPLEVSPAGFREAGRLLGGLRLPTVFVQEGGYDLERIGELVRETLLGFEEAR
jgi:acetoin utilization deacetylase AcuC-like enzyme